MLKKTFKIRGMDCTSCATLIELDLEDRGVKASCSYARESLEVEFDNQKVTEEEIKRIVKKSGFYLA